MASNSTNSYESRVSGILAGTIVPTVLASCFVIARFYSRRCLSGRWALDDTLIAISWVVSLGLAVCSCLSIIYGAGHHQVQLSIAEAVAAKKLQFADHIIYQFVLCTTKLAIASFYLRVFVDKWSKRFIYALLAFISVSALTMEFVIIFACKPVPDTWALEHTNCLPSRPSYIGNTIVNVVSNLALIAFVIPRILPLQLPRRQKIYISSVVCIGFLVIIASILRLISIIRFKDSSDPAWEVMNITTWMSVEVGTGLFCASAPCLQPLIRKLFPTIASSLNSNPGKAPNRLETGDFKTNKSKRQSTQSHKSAIIPHLKKAFTRKVKTGMEEVKLKTINAKRLSRGTFAYAIRKREDAFKENDWEDLTKGDNVEHWLGRIVDEEAVKEAAVTVDLAKVSIDISQIGTRKSGPSSVMTSG